MRADGPFIADISVLARSNELDTTSMKIFLAGASGAIGQALIPLLVHEGHEVFGAFRNAANSDRVRSLGATPVVIDALDGPALNDRVAEITPEVVIHQLTAIPHRLDLRTIDRDFELTNRLRSEGTRNLVKAAVNAGAQKFIAQSFAGWPYAPHGATLKTEDDDLDPAPAPKLKAMLDAIKTLEHTVLSEQNFTGVVLRYGPLYGPHTSIASNGTMVEEIRAHKVPIVGQGTGIWSFVHVDDAASATLAALNHAQRGIYNVVDDDPAPVSDWLPFLAQCTGAKPPLNVPSLPARLLIGEHAVSLMNDVRGVSNAKAKTELDWTPKWSSWRTGFLEALD
jgi:2-alkyl-3-oxoalkanoate reductase